MSRRILLVHNLYRQAGGEDRVVEAEAEMLRRQGHTVFRYTDDNERISGLGIARTAVEAVWSSRSYRRLSEVIRRNRIELCHFHNTFPLISPSAYYAAKRQRVPVVQTLHNYRIMCPNALLMRGGAICEDCVGRRVVWPGALRKCYRDSYAASAVAAAAISTHHLLGTWSRCVDRYIALTEFARSKFVEGGLPVSRIAIKGNFVDPDPGRGAGDGGYALFVGRLAPEKGVMTLLEAWEHVPGALPLRIAGDGPLMPSVKEAAERNPNLKWLGEISRPEVLAQMRGAGFLVCPSTWYESFGLIIVEAFATGLPVIASNLGALAELIQVERTGLLFRPGDAADLVQKVRWAMEHPARLAEMREHARAQYLNLYTAERNYGQLIDIYESVLAGAAPASRALQPAMELR
jgi:glycosyltransferase involved in cell wall biosynthesis